VPEGSSELFVCRTQKGRYNTRAAAFFHELGLVPLAICLFCGTLAFSLWLATQHGEGDWMLPQYSISSKKPFTI
jgi:hypothetical protein